jgi:pyruvate-formate lyase-activating enzyme
MGLNSVIKYELLPYHPLGESKRLAIGEEKRRFTVPSDEYMNSLSCFTFERGFSL